MTLAQQDWELFTRTISSLVFGWKELDDTEKMAAMLRTCVDQATMLEGLSAFEGEASEEQRRLPEAIQAPTLVLQHEQGFFPRAEVAHELAAMIPDASLTMLDGAWITTIARAEAAARTILDFFGYNAGIPQRATSAAITTILFTDIAAHTDMMSRLGDVRGREVLRAHERVTRETLLRHSGTEVKSMGDGFMASFGSVTAAVDCAIELQRAFSSEAEIKLRVGINAGEPIAEDGDLFGASVILASRICAQAEPGEILIPEPVRHLLAGKSYTYADRGEFAAKGFDDVVRLFSVRWQ